MFGFDSQNWQRARQQVFEVLVDQARRCELISYSDLVEQIDAIDLEMSSDKDRGALGWLLGDVSRETDETGIGMLSAMAVLKDRNVPAFGFYDLARQLGYEFDDPELFWANQYEQVIEHYRRRT